MKKKAVLVIQSATLTAKTKAGRKKQMDRILAQANRTCAELEKRGYR